MTVTVQERVLLVVVNKVKVGCVFEAHCFADVCLFSQFHLLSARACVFVCGRVSETDSLIFVVWSNLM